MIKLMKQGKRIWLFVLVAAFSGCYYYDHSKVKKRFYLNGQVKEIDSVKNGKKNGLFVRFDADGTVTDSGHYKNDSIDGTMLSFFHNGKIDRIAHYKMEAADGWFIFFTETGDTQRMDLDNNYKALYSVIFNDGKRFIVLDYRKHLKIEYAGKETIVDSIHGGPE